MPAAPEVKAPVKKPVKPTGPNAQQLQAHFKRRDQLMSDEAMGPLRTKVPAIDAIMQERDNLRIENGQLLAERNTLRKGAEELAKQVCTVTAERDQLRTDLEVATAPKGTEGTEGK